MMLNIMFVYVLCTKCEQRVAGVKLCHLMRWHPERPSCCRRVFELNFYIQTHKHVHNILCEINYGERVLSPIYEDKVRSLSMHCW